jgi:hypothetical protein
MCVLSSWWAEGVILCLYADDILIFGTNINLINEVKSFCQRFFYMKEMIGADANLNINLIKGLFGLVVSRGKVLVSCNKSCCELCAAEKL